MTVQRWWCSYCNTFYAEYVNGCPRCHLGEPGTSTSVVLVDAVKTAEGWRKLPAVTTATLPTDQGKTVTGFAIPGTSIFFPGDDGERLAREAIERMEREAEGESSST